MIWNGVLIMYNKVAEFIKDRIDMQPVIGLILGSGLGRFPEPLKTLFTSIIRIFPVY